MRKKSKLKTMKIIDAIKKGTPRIIFKTRSFIVTLRNKDQLSRWLKMYPESTYEIISN